MPTLTEQQREEIRKYFLKHFRSWEESTGHKQTITAFAEYLNIPQPTVNRWMRGLNPPSGDNLHLVALKLRDDAIYTILDEPKPDFLPGDILRPLAQLIQYFPQEHRQLIRDAIVNAIEKIYNNKTTNSEE